MENGDFPYSYISLPGICKLANFLVYLRSLGRHTIAHHCTQMITEDSPSAELLTSWAEEICSWMYGCTCPVSNLFAHKNI